MQYQTTTPSAQMGGNTNNTPEIVATEPVAIRN